MPTKPFDVFVLATVFSLNEDEYASFNFYYVVNVHVIMAGGRGICMARPHEESAPRLSRSTYK